LRYHGEDQDDNQYADQYDYQNEYDDGDNYNSQEVVDTDTDTDTDGKGAKANTVGEKAADLTMFGETTGCGVNRDCLSCANDRHKGCTWYGNVGCVRARKPFQCTANPFVAGEVKEQCLAFQDCKTCTTQAGCVFYKGTCTYSAGTNCLEDNQCINYPTQCPNVPLVVEERMFNGGGYNPVLPPIQGPLGHPGPIQYQDISVMTDPYKNPFERQKRFHENMWANPNPPFGGLVNPNPPFAVEIYNPRAVHMEGGYNSPGMYSPQIQRPTVLRSNPRVVHEFAPTQTIIPKVTPFNPWSTQSFSPQPTSRVYQGSHGRRSNGGRGHYNSGHNRFGHHYGWN
jgi:hypothetical protein